MQSLTNYASPWYSFENNFFSGNYEKFLKNFALNKYSLGICSNQCGTNFKMFELQLICLSIITEIHKHLTPSKTAKQFA